MKTPVAFIIFKRPEHTQKVFDVIRQVKPSKLLVIADGARVEFPDEIEKCQATRAIIEQVDWECEVLKNYSDINLGCGKRVSSGLNWVFDNVPEAIILEDDCLPHSSFFRFCEELLERYRYDNRIMSISAQNVQLGHQRSQYSYYFSRYFHCWGWATWRRAWQEYDFEMRYWQETKSNNLLQDILMDSQAVKYWAELFDYTFEADQKSWDYQWLFSCWLQNGLSIIPNVNLVSNIGFGIDSTHTRTKDNKTVDMALESVKFPLQHPPYIIRNVKADTFAQRVAYEGGWFNRLKSSARKVIKKAVLK